jgi:hypothetical protein
LLKRWAETCPEKIHPRRSHKLGDLGFVAGTYVVKNSAWSNSTDLCYRWWINPLFAHHAGIIGLEACDGGTTYDKHGAYALLLKDTGEIEAASEERFTYRVPQHDKGKFRLTSATPKSRDPVRVLRSHSINSVWGPKAGVRYEGLYSVRGWSIKQAKSADLAGGQWKEGDILFDVRFERTDSVPMSVVTKRPTAIEVDDYAEYKRLRKFNRDGKRKEPSAPPIAAKAESSTPLKTAPPVAPPSHPKPLPMDTSLNERRNGMFRPLHFDKEAHVRVLEKEEVVSPKSIPGIDPPNLAAKSNTLAVPVKPKRNNTHSKADNFPSDERHRHPSPAGSNASSAHTYTSVTTVPGINIREVAPWIDYDAGLTMPSPPEDSLIVHQRPIITQSIATESIKTLDMTKSFRTGTSRDTSAAPRETETPSLLGHRSDSGDKDKHGRREDGDFRDQLTPHVASKKDKRKSILMRSRNPMVKLFDGVVDDDDDDGKEGPDDRTDSTEPIIHSVTTIPFSDPFFTANPKPRLLSRRPKFPCMTRRSLISRSRALTPLGSPVCTPTFERVEGVSKECEESEAESKLREMMEKFDSVEMGRWRHV